MSKSKTHLAKHVSRVVIKKPRIVFKDLSKEIVDKTGRVGPVGLAYFAGHRAEIEIRQSDKELFLTAFHEIVGHLTLPTLSEKEVIKLETIVGTEIWNKVILRLKRKWSAQLKKSKSK